MKSVFLPLPKEDSVSGLRASTVDDDVSHFDVRDSFMSLCRSYSAAAVY